jgi:hypothetical protein
MVRPPDPAPVQIDPVGTPDQPSAGRSTNDLHLRARQCSPAREGQAAPGRRGNPGCWRPSVLRAAVSRCACTNRDSLYDATTPIRVRAKRRFTEVEGAARQGVGPSRSGSGIPADPSLSLAHAAGCGTRPRVNRDPDASLASRRGLSAIRNSQRSALSRSHSLGPRQEPPSSPVRRPSSPTARRRAAIHCRMRRMVSCSALSRAKLTPTMTSATCSAQSTASVCSSNMPLCTARQRSAKTCALGA